MNSLEKKSVFQLVLTTIGKKFLENSLLEEPAPISLIIAVGASGKLASANDTGLHQFKKEVKPNLLAPDNEKNRQGLHINAIFPASNEEFDIKEIGLFVKVSQKSILLGRYANEKIIAKMTAEVDLLLDIVVDIGTYNFENITINSNDYKPAFSLAKATHDRYGNVRFASESDIIKKEKNLALSVDALNYANILPKMALRDHWSVCKPLVTSEPESEPSNKIVNFSIIGLSYIPGNPKQVAILLVPKKSIENKIKKICTFFYSLDQTINDEKHVHKQYIYVACNAFQIRKTTNRIHCLVSAVEDKKFSMHTFEIKDLKAPGKNDSRSELEGLEFAPGSVFYFNKKAYAVGGYDYPSNEIYYGEKNTPPNNKTLLNRRQKPLIHLIQDKVYILGGSQASETNYTSVEIFDPINMLSFAPFTPPIIELSNTDNTTSCVLENKIYVFFIKHFEKGYNKDKFYYCYDYLGNNWIKREIAQEIELGNPEKNLSGKAITIGDKIYLFFTNSIANNDKEFELSVISLQPV